METTFRWALQSGVPEFSKRDTDHYGAPLGRDRDPVRSAERLVLWWGDCEGGVA